MIQQERVREITAHTYKGGDVLLALGRDLRAHDNDALLYAAHTAQKEGVKLIVVTTVWPQFQGATSRYYDFFYEGLRETEQILREHNIPLVVLFGREDATLKEFIQKHAIGFLVTDSLPLRFSKLWKKRLASRITIPWHEVDAHNIVPVWITSSKKEFAARTIRPKLTSLLPQYLTEYEILPTFPVNNLTLFPPLSYTHLIKNTEKIITPDKSICFRGGEEVAKKTLIQFLESKLSRYREDRNAFLLQGQSDLSPYISKGMISRRRIALSALAYVGSTIQNHLSKENTSQSDTEASLSSFLEELIIRSELAENYCFYEENYDNIAGAPEWAQKILQKEKATKRQYSYTQEQFEHSLTHDNLWNSIQRDLVAHGKIHGYLRMYWAKKILEWSQSPEEAVRIAIYLNDIYEIDGLDPNGYAGIMWSIAGLHDRPWFTRPIFGTVRYMAESGVKKHGDILKYIKYHGK